MNPGEIYMHRLMQIVLYLSYMLSVLSEFCCSYLLPVSIESCCSYLLALVRLVRGQGKRYVTEQLRTASGHRDDQRKMVTDVRTFHLCLVMLLCTDIGPSTVGSRSPVGRGLLSSARAGKISSGVHWL